MSKLGPISDHIGAIRRLQYAQSKSDHIQQVNIEDIINPKQADSITHTYESKNLDISAQIETSKPKKNRTRMCGIF